MPDISKYYFADGSTMQREYGKTPNGNDMAGRWVLRDKDGNMITYNQYRYDIIDTSMRVVDADID